VLLTRLPLTPKDAFDLHVLSLPPAFALSQDQTLKLKSLNRPLPSVTAKAITNMPALSRAGTINGVHIRPRFQSPEFRNV
jgi:hypothetical protein